MRSWRSNPESVCKATTPSPSKSTGSNFIINASPVQWKPGNPWRGLVSPGTSAIPYERLSMLVAQGHQLDIEKRTFGIQDSFSFAGVCLLVSV